WSRLPQGIPKMITLTLNASGAIAVSFVCSEKISMLRPTGRSIGLDVGIMYKCITSEGEKFENPKALNQRGRRLKIKQRQFARTQERSERHERARIKVAKEHEHIANIRLDANHKQTTHLVRNYDVIAGESLNISGMLKNRCFSKAVFDAGWGEFFRQIEYKAKWYGRTFIRCGRFDPTSKTCSACGHRLESLPLKVREWICPGCGVYHDRDINAAKNVLTFATGGRPGGYARGG
ncbi:MAG: RNA-guided endonuclease TnpB family protein, partial [Pseudomonadota bacterium]